MTLVECCVLLGLSRELAWNGLLQNVFGRLGSSLGHPPVALAVERGAKLIAITDSRMSPLAKEAKTTLLVQDNSTFGFRSLTSAMGLAQSLFIALVYALELPYRSTSPKNIG